MSKQKNQDLIIKTLKKIYKGTSVENMLKDVHSIEDLSSQNIESRNIAYPITYNLVKYYLEETLNEEKVSKIYKLRNRWKLNYDICTNYIAGINSLPPLKEGFLEGEQVKKALNKVWTEEDLQLDDCKGPVFLRK